MNTIIGAEIDLKSTPELLNWCENNLKFENPEYAKKQRMNLWLGKTPKHILLYRKEFDRVIVPYGVGGRLKKEGFLFPPYSMDFDYATSINIEEKEKLTLYDYQKEALGKLLDQPNGILVSPAGSGKSQIAIALIKKIHLTTLVIVHTKDLLKQFKERFERYFSASVGTITDGKIDIQDVTFATVQTLSKCNLDNIKRTFGLIIVDECHNISSKGYTNFTMYAKVLNSLSARHKIGITATLHRSDQMTGTTTALIGDIIHEVPKEAVAEKVQKAKIKVINTGYQLEEFSEAYDTDGTVIYSKLLTEIGNIYRRNVDITREIDKNSKAASCLVLSDRLDQLRSIKELLKYGVMIDGSMTSKAGKKQREQALEDIRSGKEKVLFASYKLAKEGLDLPILSRLFLVSPVKDLAVVIQAVGRIERIAPDKPESIVFDFVDDIGICQSMFRKRKAIYKKNGNKVEV